MRGLHTAIVDEADHVLIDEAVTPLIISREAPPGDLTDACRRAAEIARLPRSRAAITTIEAVVEGHRLPERTQERIAELTRRIAGLWRSAARREELVVTALKAREFFHRGQQYVVDEQQKIVIVDESTGRVMPQRTWQQGLHQAIEAKEGVPLTPPTETLARLSFQRFFRFYPRLCGVTGTAREAAPRALADLRLPVVRHPDAQTVRSQAAARTGSSDHRGKSGTRWSRRSGGLTRAGRRCWSARAASRPASSSPRLLEARGLDFSTAQRRASRARGAIVAEAG